MLQKMKKKQSGPPTIALKFERGDLVSWQEDGKKLTGFVCALPGQRVPAGYLDVRARGDTFGRILWASDAKLRLKRNQVTDYWYWL